MNTKRIEKTCEKLLTELNPDWKKNHDMQETPIRIAKMYAHFFRNDNVAQYFEKKFPTQNSQIILLKDIECFGVCPHHLIPVVYKVHIGYIPKGWVIGLSKLARIAIGLCSYPKLQENFTSELAEVINKNLHPKGVIVVVEGLHSCIRSRGVELPSSSLTSEVKGCFLDNPTLKQEFFNLIPLR